MVDKAKEGIIESVKNSIVSVITGTGDIVNAVADTISATVSNLVKDAGKTGASLIESLHDVIGAAISGVVGTGKDLGDAVKGLVIGTLKWLGLRGRKRTQRSEL